MDLISTPTAPTPGGHYSQATRAGGFVYVSGMLPGPAAAGNATGGVDQAHREVKPAIVISQRGGRRTSQANGRARLPTSRAIHRRPVGHVPARIRPPASQ
ncbi:hypothetical protein SAMN05414139_09897 [Burkholderia sp. D7]|nr:hypothetical protein SAMN05414139_09897 [Burkholderia sp. D7]